jgi:hypothetical protein
LAGFAGVVVVFRRESVHEWSPIDKLRLRLFLGAFWPFFTCIVFQLIAAVFQFARMILLLRE